MNKRTKILFIIYLIVAPLVYFISSAHTPNKQKQNIERFAQKFIKDQGAQNTVIAFINSHTRLEEYQQSLAQTFKDKTVSLMVFTIPSKNDKARHQQLSCVNQEIKVYKGKQYFSKAGIKADKQLPSLQLFLVDQQMKLRYQEQHFDSNLLDLSKFVSQINQIKS